MKKILLITVIVCATLAAGVFAAISATVLFGKSLRGSGNIITRTMEAPAFEQISASRAVKVVIADTDKITIEADDNLIDYVVAEVSSGELKIGISNKLKNLVNINVTVTVPNNGRIRSLDASSAASITTNVALTAPEFSIDASSAANIAASVKAEKCEIEASSAAKIKAAVIATACRINASSASKLEMAGSAAECHIDLSSASKLKAGEFTVETLNIGVSSGASASVNCTKTLDASASSGASVNYTGDCTPHINQSSGGSIRKN